MWKGIVRGIIYGRKKKKRRKRCEYGDRADASSSISPRSSSSFSNSYADDVPTASDHHNTDYSIIHCNQQQQQQQQQQQLQQQQPPPPPQQQQQRQQRQQCPVCDVKVKSTASPSPQTRKNGDDEEKIKEEEDEYAYDEENNSPRPDHLREERTRIMNRYRLLGQIRRSSDSDHESTSSPSTKLQQQLRYRSTTPCITIGRGLKEAVGSSGPQRVDEEKASQFLLPFSSPSTATIIKRENDCNNEKKKNFVDDADDSNTEEEKEVEGEEKEKEVEGEEREEEKEIEIEKREGEKEVEVVKAVDGEEEKDEKAEEMEEEEEEEERDERSNMSINMEKKEEEEEKEKLLIASLRKDIKKLKRENKTLRDTLTMTVHELELSCRTRYAFFFVPPFLIHLPSSRCACFYCI